MAFFFVRKTVHILLRQASLFESLQFHHTKIPLKIPNKCDIPKRLGKFYNLYRSYNKIDFCVR